MFVCVFVTAVVLWLTTVSFSFLNFGTCFYVFKAFTYFSDGFAHCNNAVFYYDECKKRFYDVLMENFISLDKLFDKSVFLLLYFLL